MSSGIARYLNPWLVRREKTQLRVAELRGRDGDDCRRCKRPLRFDLPPGHDQAPTLVPIGPETNSGALDNLCLCHRRCNPEVVDSTTEVQKRLQQRAQVPAGAKRRVAGRR